MRMGCGVEFGGIPKFVQLEFVKFVSCTGRFPIGDYDFLYKVGSWL